MATPPAKDSEQTFETAIERLEQIVEEMEADKMPLEQLLVRYEEGTKLVKVCQEKLEAAEKRIQIITRGGGGKPQLQEFDPAAAQSVQPAAASAAETAPPAEPETGAESKDVSLF